MYFQGILYKSIKSNLPRSLHTPLACSAFSPHRYTTISRAGGVFHELQNRGHAAQRGYQHQRRHTYWVCVRCGDRCPDRKGEIDTVTARVLSLVIYGRLRFFGLLGREDDIIIKWQDIEVIGDETILVCYNDFYRVKKKPHIFGS